MLGTRGGDSDRGDHNCGMQFVEQELADKEESDMRIIQNGGHSIRQCFSQKEWGGARTERELTDDWKIVTDTRDLFTRSSRAVVQWCSGAVAQWRSGAVAQWCRGAVVQWRSGAVVQWRSGAVAQWRSGAVAQWRSGESFALIEPTYESCAAVANIWQVYHSLYIAPVHSVLYLHFISILK